MNTQVLIVVLLTVIVIMAVAGVYFMFFAGGKKEKGNEYAVPEDAVVRVRAKVNGVKGRKVTFEADIDDFMPAVEDLMIEDDFRPQSDLERLLNPATTYEERLVIMKRMEDAGYHINSKDYDRKKAEELERREEDAEGNRDEVPAGESEKNPVEPEVVSGGDEPEPPLYEEPEPEDFGEGEVDPLSGMSLESKETEELPKGEHFVFVRKPTHDVALLTEMLDFAAGAFAEDNLSPELVLFLEMRFGARFEDSLWNDEKRARASDRVAAYDRNPQLAILTAEDWFKYLRQMVDSFVAAREKSLKEGKKDEADLKESNSSKQESAADVGSPLDSGKPSQQEPAPAKEPAGEEERDYSSLFIGKDGGKLDAMWDRLSPGKK